MVGVIETCKISTGFEVALRDCHKVSDDIWLHSSNWLIAAMAERCWKGPHCMHSIPVFQQE